MSTKKLTTAVAAACMLAGSSALSAQTPAGEWILDLRGGAIVYDDASALQTGGTVSLEALYHITPRFAIGPSIDYVLTQSDGEFFPAVVEFGPDSLRVMNVGQTVGALNYGGVAVVDVLPASALSLYLAGGGGGYRLYLDAQSNEGAARVDGWMMQAGGGIRYSLTEAAGIQLDARDIIYGDFDREQLNPVGESQRPTDDDLNLVPPRDLPEAKSTLHNFRVTLGFSYIPGF